MEQTSQTSDNPSLKKYLHPIEALALSFGCSVGWGAFVMPATNFLPFSGPIGTLIGVVIGALLLLIIGQNYHYMMNEFPDSGGTFTYTRKIFGNDHGFLSAWFLCLTYIAIIWANSTALALAARYTLGDFFQFGFHYQLAGYDIYFGESLLCSMAVLISGVICISGKRLSAVIQTIMAGCLIGGIIVTFVSALQHSDAGISSISPFFASDQNEVGQVLKTLALVPWAFVGYESISHSAEEFSFPLKKTFRIILISIIAIALAYILLVFAAAMIQPEGYENWKDYIADIGNLKGIASVPTFYTASTAIGSKGITVIGFTMLGGVFTGLIGNMIALSRLLFAISKEYDQMKWFTILNRKNIPANAIITITGISMLIPFLGRMATGWIIDVSTLGAALAYGYTSASAMKNAKEKGNRKIEITGIIGLVSAVMFTAILLFPNSASGGTLAKESYLILAVWSIMGFLVFRFVFRKDNKQKFGKSLIVWIALMSLIFLTSIMWMYETTKETAENATENILTYQSQVYDEYDVHLNHQNQQKIEENLQKQMSNINHTLLLGIVVQTGLMILALAILFSVYSTMKSRENQMQIDKIRAEENSKSKTFFLSNMSHDLRTPMNAIIGYTILAQKQGVTEEEMRDYLKKIDQSSKQLLSLINDVLEMSRIESGKMELELVPTDLVQTMKDVRDMFSTQMEKKGVIYSIDTSEINDRYVMCDRQKLDRILLNLISNAYKFTPEGGSVRVILKQIHSENEKGIYELRVKDSGIGMSPEFAEKVFEAFERERTSTVSGIQGTGLGLAITKSIVLLMNGTIQVKTALQEGTEFIVHIAFSITDQIVEEKTQMEQLENHHFDEIRLLLVEDIFINREIAKKLLITAGFEVETAENGQMAVEMLKDSQEGYYDVILMDIQMPVMDGHTATKIIRSLENPVHAKIPIIAMTANAFAEEIEAEKESGMDAHISKPIDPEKMIETIAKVIYQHKKNK